MKNFDQTKKFLVNTIGIFLLLFCFAPVLSYAAQSVTAGNTGITYECGDGPTAGNCTFADFVTAAQNVVVFMRNIALMFSVVVIAYAGFKYMISGDNPKARGEANNMLQAGAIGIAVILGAWLIVHLIVSALVSPAVLQNSAVTI